MKSKVDLVWLSRASDQPKWEHGEVFCIGPEPKAVHELTIRHLSATKAVAWLFWDGALGTPDPVVVDQLLKLPGDVWHAGLKLRTGGLPGMIDFIAPTWMLNRDPDENILATSWRLSLRACLMRTEVLRRLGGIRPEFKSLDAAALELGHRLVIRGAVTRHAGQLVSVDSIKSPSLPFEDELRFTHYRFGRFWTRWALVRAVLTGYVSLIKAVRASGEVFKASAPAPPPPFKSGFRERIKVDSTAKVSVLIPTLSRPQYLRTLLGELRHQTIRPFEIIVVDQTPAQDRDTDLSSDFADLPLNILYLDRAGQCSSRNAGLEQVKGDYILFLDDDDQIPPDLVEKHLRGLAHSGAQVSSGVAEEDGAGPLPEDFTYTRTSNVFPTNNSLVRREILQKSGLFDLAFDRGQRADHDLGMRIYLSGALMTLNPEIAVVHHHAPVGGLRAHKARAITYARSRQKLSVRHLPSVTEFYLAQRYFSPRQVREMFWLRVFGTFSVRGSRAKKVMKILTGLVCLPDTLMQCHRKYRQAAVLLKTFPQISELPHNNIRSILLKKKKRSLCPLQFNCCGIDLKMRLLLLSSEFPPGPGGIGTHAHRLTTELSAIGWSNLVVTSQNYVSEEEISRFNLAQPFPVACFRSVPVAPVEAGYRLLIASRHIKKYKPDVLLASGNRAVWLAGILARRHRLPWVAIGHGTEFGIRSSVAQRLTRWAFSNASTVVCVSKFTHQQMFAAGIRPRSSHVIENGADPNQFTLLPDREVEDFRQSLGFRDSQILLTVGRVSERKGQSSVIRALPYVLDKAPRTHYVMVGLPSEEKQCRELAHELGVSAHVHFMGRAKPEVLLQFMNACEVFVMTSRYTAGGDFEGYGIAVVEAALCGKPAVVSVDCGLAEAIVDGVTGYAVDPANPQAVARALVRLLRDNDLRRAMGRAARARAIREQTWEQRAQAYDIVLREVVKSNASSTVKILDRQPTSGI